MKRFGRVSANILHDKRLKERAKRIGQFTYLCTELNAGNCESTAPIGAISHAHVPTVCVGDLLDDAQPEATPIFSRRVTSIKTCRRARLIQYVGLVVARESAYSWTSLTVNVRSYVTVLSFLWLFYGVLLVFPLLV
jgi:hypothetical protein